MKKQLKQIFDWRLVLTFSVLALVLASPFIYRIAHIHELYVYPDVREHVLESVFFLRENYGVTIADLSIKDIVLDGPSIYITIHEKYHGFVDTSLYDDLEQDYIIRYSYDTDKFSVKDIIRGR